MSTPLPPDAEDTPSDVAGAARHAHPPPGTADFKAVARVSTQAKLTTVRLTRLEALIGLSPGEVPAVWSDLADVVTVSAEQQIDAAAAALRVSCGFRATYPAEAAGHGGDASVSSRPESGVMIAATFELAYELGEPDRVSADDAEQFARVNGVLHAWPYWREIAQNTSVRMGISPLVIQTFKIPSPYDPEAERPSDEMLPGDDPGGTAPASPPDDPSAQA